ncbi:hypothetical protein ACVW2L_001447 [Mucilaginibacter sp. HD30]
MEKIENCKVYGDWRDLVDDPDIDIVSIFHAAIASHRNGLRWYVYWKARVVGETRRHK